MADILFVDDQPHILQSLRLLFHDYEVLTAENATEALMHLQENPDVAVVVSDQRMPGMQGIELLRQVKVLYPHAIRILLTGYADIDAIISSVNDGEVFRFIPKPWEAAKLRETIQLAMRIFQRKNFAETTFVERRKQPRERPCVLLIDDNPKHLEAMKTLLEKDYDVSATRDFDEAMSLSRRRQIATVICDTHSQGKCGIEFLIELKERFPEITAIMHSQQKDAEVAMRLVNEVRVFRYVVKPFRRTEFLEIVKAAVQCHFLWRQKPTLNDKTFESETPVFSGHFNGTAQPKSEHLITLLEKGYETFERFLDRLPIAAGVLKIGDTFQKANEPLCKMLGYSKEEFASLRIDDLLQHQDVSNRMATILNQFQSGKKISSWEMIYATKQKQVKLAKVTAAVCARDGDVLLYGFLEEIV